MSHATKVAKYGKNNWLRLKKVGLVTTEVYQLQLSTLWAYL